ncbi:unnamed protein product [Phyllotreta striolata]|uniref:Odorant receptor n=1 Tax=Phyllotreta striolata TaxID=444603 RepID=A0A9N9TP54_PHYSR|nr:unnamed protein product [Phyllotreta striolata]
MTEKKSLIRENFYKTEMMLRNQGIYPVEGYPIASLFYAYLLYFGFTALIPLLGFCNIIFAESSERMGMLSNSFIFFEMGVSMFKHWPFIRHPDITKKMMDKWTTEMFTSDEPMEMPIIKKSLKAIDFVFYLFLAFSIGGPVGLTLNVLFSSHDELKLDIYTFGVDVIHNKFLYVLTNVYLIIGYVHGTLGHFAVDIFIAGLMSHCSLQLSLIKFRLENMDKYLDKDLRSVQDDNTFTEEVNDEIYRRISHCVDHYDTVMNYVKEIEDMYSVAAFSQFLAGSLVYAICLLYFMQLKALDFNFVYILTFFFPMIMVVFTYCYYGDRISEESSSIGGAIFSSPFYNYNKKCNSSLIILMEKTKRPIKFTAGKLLELSLDTFVLIIKRSYSLLAVLRNYNN